MNGKIMTLINKVFFLEYYTYFPQNYLENFIVYKSNSTFVQEGSETVIR